MSKNLIFRQLIDFESFTYTYILGCAKTRNAVIIDPVFEQAKRDAKLAKELDLNLIYGLNTHVHADHITGTSKLKEFFPAMKSGLSGKSGGVADKLLKQGDLLQIGDIELEVAETPGHTDGCLTFISHQLRAAFTGDALLIRGCGRTDFQQGSSRALYQSVHQKILDVLPEDYRILVGHNYEGILESTVGEEIKFNPRIMKSEEEFVKIMSELKLAHPKQIQQALPANLKDGDI
ncbi:unnamed protein product [Caenorhabditis angaria]|uniref:Persulfide dioxygenase ETHE1, mitochondrial n=1 Tax=Caenorhabditis angaria TaxID=860376 RepID=A0A9P1ILU3_9PELO|nr:unnamed protein product [Caenorhabditis angaria]